MRREESRYPKDWFRIGDRELRRAQNHLRLGDLDGAGFNLQQAIEKYLKGYLLAQGWELRRIHDLETLVNEAIIYDPSFEEFRAACQQITQFYIEERYPCHRKFRAFRRGNKGVFGHYRKADREDQSVSWKVMFKTPTTQLTR